jgi:hypothetical protein
MNPLDKLQEKWKFTDFPSGEYKMSYVFGIYDQYGNMIAMGMDYDISGKNLIAGFSDDFANNGPLDFGEYGEYAFDELTFKHIAETGIAEDDDSR